jgi:hypothetical protein
MRAMTAGSSSGSPLADAGCWHCEQMQRTVDRRVQVVIPPDTSRRRTSRRNWDGGR